MSYYFRKGLPTYGIVEIEIFTEEVEQILKFFMI